MCKIVWFEKMAAQLPLKPWLTSKTRASGEHVAAGEELVAATVLSAAAHDAHVRVDGEDEGSQVDRALLIEWIVHPKKCFLNN